MSVYPICTRLLPIIVAVHRQCRAALILLIFADGQFVSRRHFDSLVAPADLREIGPGVECRGRLFDQPRGLAKSLLRRKPNNGKRESRVTCEIRVDEV